MTTAVSNRPLIKRGSKGQDVARIQTSLQKAGFTPGKVDSDFGSKTDEAVRNFQKANNLEVDGIVGKDTWALLQKYSTPPQMVHTVQEGETFWTIGKKWGISDDAIQKANPNLNPTNLQVGTQVVIPNAGGTVNDTSPSGDNFEKAWKFFKDKGFSDGATAGIMGNLKQESTTMDPRQKQYNNGPGRGIAQWERGGRWEELKAWANKNGKDVYALETQLEFIMHELENESYTVSLLKKYGGVPGLKKLGIDDAVIAFERCFERAGDKALGDRKNFAYQIYNQFAKKVKV